MDSIAVYDVKPNQLSVPVAGPPRPAGPTFDLELEHRVWLAKYRVDPGDRRATDPQVLEWDAYEPSLSIPELWGPSMLSTKAQFGGRWSTGDLLAGPVDGPVPGDRVVMFRQSPYLDVVGVVLITGASYGQNGAVRYSHRPLVSCLAPVKLKSALRTDADLAEAWSSHFGRASRSQGPFMALDGPALSGVLRTVGIDPILLCGPVEQLPDCSMSNVEPGAAYRSATYLHTELSAEARLERRAVAEAVDWLLADRGEDLASGFTDVETVAGAETADGATTGVCLVARHDDIVAEVVAVGVVGSSIDQIELCPTVVLEAVEASADGRNWSVVVTLDALGAGRTLRFDALAVATCFDPQSGRVDLGG